MSPREHHDRDEAAGPDAAIVQAAAAWVARADRGLNAAEQSELRAWQAANGRHAIEYARARAAWRAMNQMGASPELAGMADDFLARAQARNRRRRLVRLGGWSAAAAAAIVFGVLQRTPIASEPAAPALATARPAGENYRVLASTARRETLPDGTVAELNGASRIEVNYSADARRVRLVEGEAHFIVAKMPERPFYVTAGSVTVRAVGTAFNVRLASDAIEVLVTEGTVKLESAEARAGASAIADGDSAPALTVGQRAVISRGRPATPQPDIAIGEVDKAEIEATLGWQTTRLVFNNTPLVEVVAGFNRYNVHQLTLGDPKLRSRTLTGIFRADNLDGFLRLLKASVDVRDERRAPNETVLLPVR